MPAEATINFIMIILDQLDLRSIDWDKVAQRHGITNGHAARMRYSRLKKSFNGHIPTPRRERSSTGVSKRRKSAGKSSKVAKVEKLEESMKRESELPETLVSYNNESELTPPLSPAQPLFKIESVDDYLPKYDPLQITHDRFDPGSQYRSLSMLPSFPLLGTFQPTDQPPYRCLTQTMEDSGAAEFNKLMSIHEARESDDVPVKQEPKWGEEYERVV